jgi:hypothetical protein
MKHRHAIFALYGIALLQAYTLFETFRAAFYVAEIDPTYSMGPVMTFLPIYSVAIGGACLYVANELKKETLNGWLGALMIAVVGIPSYAVIGSAVIAFTLLKKEVRAPYIAKFEETY